MSDKFKSYFSEIISCENYKKASESTKHRDFYFGLDQNKRPTMLLYYSGKVIKVSSSKMIEVSSCKYSREECRIQFSLSDNKYFEQFEAVCMDIIEYCNRYDVYVEKHAVHRWESWKQLFDNENKEIISKNKIKGLLGEMLYILKLSNTGVCMEDIIEAWTGPDNRHQDFVLNDKKVEIKTISLDSNTIKISSIEQLDFEGSGFLQVYEIYPTTKIDEKLINLNKLNKLICNKIDNNKTFESYMKKLSLYGYYVCEEYEEYNFILTKEILYNIDEDFPRIRRSDMKEAIGHVSYEIFKNCISAWEV